MLWLSPKDINGHRPQLLGSLQQNMRFCMGHESMRLSAPEMKFRSNPCRDAVVTPRALVPLHASHPRIRPCSKRMPSGSKWSQHQAFLGSDQAKRQFR